MSILESQYFRPAILFALAIPLFVYDFSSVNWIVSIHPVDTSKPTVFTDAFSVPRNGPYVVEFGLSGRVDDCVWGVVGAPCENTHREFEGDWQVTEEGRVVLDGHSSAGFKGTWSTAEGASGVTLGSFDGLTGKQYAMSFSVRSAAPDLATHTPRISVEAGQTQRNVDMLKHAAAFVAGMLLLIGSVVVAMRTARARRATLGTRHTV